MAAVPLTDQAPGGPHVDAKSRFINEDTVFEEVHISVVLLYADEQLLHSYFRTRSD